MSKLIKIDKEYKQWISELSERFRISQLRASVKVNSEMLRFYWLLGKDIVELKAESKWGDKILQNISLDLQDKLPGVKGMSETNIDYMKRFYILYSQLNVISPQVVGENNKSISPQPVDDLFSIPWGHHRFIIDKCYDNPEKAYFYVQKTIQNNWSRSVLLNFLDTDLYERQGKAISNFKKALPSLQSDLAQEMTKDPYNFDFLALTEEYKEKELKEAVNYILKQPEDNPTIGLLVCKTKDNVLAQYALESSSQPIGISEYELTKLYPADFKGTLPSIEEIENELKDNFNS